MSKPITLHTDTANEFSPTKLDKDGDAYAVTQAYVPATSTIYELDDAEQTRAFIDDITRQPSNVLLLAADDELTNSIDDIGDMPLHGTADGPVIETSTQQGGPVSVYIPQGSLVGVFNGPFTKQPEGTPADIILISQSTRRPGTVILTDPSDERVLVDGDLTQTNHAKAFGNTLSGLDTDVAAALDSVMDTSALDRDHFNATHYGIITAYEHPVTMAAGTRDPSDPALHPSKGVAAENRQALDAGLNGIEPDNPDEAEAVNA